jgi:hypothetical protein
MLRKTRTPGTSAKHPLGPGRKRSREQPVAEEILGEREGFGGKRVSPMQNLLFVIAEPSQIWDIIARLKS